MQSKLVGKRRVKTPDCSQQALLVHQIIKKPLKSACVLFGHNINVYVNVILFHSYTCTKKQYASLHKLKD